MLFAFLGQGRDSPAQSEFAGGEAAVSEGIVPVFPDNWVDLVKCPVLDGLPVQVNERWDVFGIPNGKPEHGDLLGHAGHIGIENSHHRSAVQEEGLVRVGIEEVRVGGLLLLVLNVDLEPHAHGKLLHRGPRRQLPGGADVVHLFGVGVAVVGDGESLEAIFFQDGCSLRSVCGLGLLRSLLSHLRLLEAGRLIKLRTIGSLFYVRFWRTQARRG